MRLNKEQKNVIIGSLLGDANMQTFTKGKTWRLRMLHSKKQYDYILHKFNLLKTLCNGELKFSKVFDKRTLKFYERYYFNTLVNPSLRFFGKLFYKYNEQKKKFIKIVPKNIQLFLTPQVIAYWYMDDGSLKWLNHSNGMRICTDSFSLLSLKRIIKALLNKFNIKINLNKNKNGYRLLINEENSLIFRNIIEPYILPSMKYKVSNGLKGHL